MAFLDNSGDIILDAVLTDLGRERLARGTFSISKFALGDEEINYALYNGTHPSGSAHYDLDILKTPVLESFTSDQSIMKSRLITLSRDNILYMPILKLNNNTYNACKAQTSDFQGFLLVSDANTYQVGGNTDTTAPKVGFLHGVPGNKSSETTHICVDQGINTNTGGMGIETRMDDSLIESAYLVKIDSRLMKLEAFISDDNTPSIRPTFKDDDGIETYYIVQGQGSGGSAIMGPRSDFTPRRRSIISDTMETEAKTAAEAHEVFTGPLGTVLRIVPRVTTQIQQSTALFDELGSASTTNIAFRGGNITAHKFIDTLINVTGVTTGYSIDIPVRIIKGTTFSA
jgi:hypothetical protein